MVVGSWSCRPTVAVTFPPAETPTFLGSGLTVTGATPGNSVTLGSLDALCARYVAARYQSDRYWGVYLKVRYPGLTALEVSYRGAPATSVKPNTQLLGLTEGPRPWTTQMTSDVQTTGLYSWHHEESLRNDGYLDATIAILFGAQLPPEGELRLWTVSLDSRRTGPDAASAPLVLELTRPIEIRQFEARRAGSAVSTITERQSFDVAWDVRHAATVEIQGPGFRPGAQPSSGSTAVTAPCAGDSGTRLGYTLTARKSDCSAAARTARVDLPVTQAGVIDLFRGVLRSVADRRFTEGVPLVLEWNAAGATDVVLSGEGVDLSVAHPPVGSTTAVPGMVPIGLAAQQKTWRLTAHLPAASCRASETAETTLLVHAAGLQPFWFVEYCLGWQANACVDRAVQARSQQEADTIADQTRPRNCSWQAGRCSGFRVGILCGASTCSTRTVDARNPAEAITRAQAQNPGCQVRAGGC